MYYLFAVRSIVLCFSETILVKLLSVGMREGFAPSFLLIIATMVEAPLSITLDALTNTFR